MKAVICVFMLVAFYVLCSFEAIPCLWTNPVTNKQYNLSVLANSTGSYTWNAEWLGVTYTWQVQVCDNVKNPISSACNIPAPSYQYNPQTKTCTQLGDITTTSFDIVPSQNGVMITYYHGFYVNDVTSILSRIYVECDPNGSGVLSFEHIRNCTYGTQYHFTVATPVVC